MFWVRQKIGVQERPAGAQVSSRAARPVGRRGGGEALEPDQAGQLDTMSGGRAARRRQGEPGM